MPVAVFRRRDSPDHKDNRLASSIMGNDQVCKAKHQSLDVVKKMVQGLVYDKRCASPEVQFGPNLERSSSLKAGETREVSRIPSTAKKYAPDEEHDPRVYNSKLSSSCGSRRSSGTQSPRSPRRTLFGSFRGLRASKEFTDGEADVGVRYASDSKLRPSSASVNDELHVQASGPAFPHGVPVILQRLGSEIVLPRSAVDLVKAGNELHVQPSGPAFNVPTKTHSSGTSTPRTAPSPTPSFSTSTTCPTLPPLAASSNVLPSRRPKYSPSPSLLVTTRHSWGGPDHVNSLSVDTDNLKEHQRHTAPSSSSSILTARMLSNSVPRMSYNDVAGNTNSGHDVPLVPSRRFKMHMSTSYHDLGPLTCICSGDGGPPCDDGGDVDSLHGGDDSILDPRYVGPLYIRTCGPAVQPGGSSPPNTTAGFALPRLSM